MTDTERGAVIGIALACLLSAALTGRARSALHRFASRMAPGASVRTSVAPSGFAGALVGRVAQATVLIEGGEIGSLALPLADRIGPLRVHVRETAVQASQTRALGMPVHRLRLVQSDAQLDGIRLLRDRDVSLLKFGSMVAEVAVDAGSVAQLVQRRLPSLSDVGVTLADNMVCIRAASSSPRARLTVLAETAVQGGEQIVLRNVRLWANGNETAQGLASLLVGSLNPVLSIRDVASTDANLVIQDVRITEGAIVARLEAMPGQSITQVGHEQHQ